MDFFTVPTLTFGVQYCFFVIGHDRRKILHFHVTRNQPAIKKPKGATIWRTAAVLQNRMMECFVSDNSTKVL